MSEIREAYRGAKIFITGGSGFMGKVLVQKILYSIPEIDKIFLLLRHKKGKSPEQRIDDVTKSLAFKRIRDECPERLRKLVVVTGDISEAGMGISEEDKALLHREVTVVFHGAATVRFNATLKDAINMNVAGTLRLMQLCVDMKNLKAVVHLSTSFCHVDQEILHEKLYSTPLDPKHLIDLTKWMDEETFEVITPSLMKPHPNSYTYSKRLAEAIVSQFYPQVPSLIVRPSIVVPAVEEPMPGWVDNINGPIGIMIGAGKGAIRSMHCHGEHYAEVIPVDFAINGLIIMAADFIVKERSNEIPVYNLTQGKTNQATWGEILEMGRKAHFNNPFGVMLWYPNGNIRSNKTIHDICVILFHWIPAYLIDGLMFILNKKPFMIKVQTRIQDGLSVLQYFTTKKWSFENDKVLSLREKMNPIDKKLFSLDFENVDQYTYLTDCILGARQYCLKEDPATLPRSRKIIKVLYVLDRTVAMLCYLLMAWLLVSLSGPARSALDSAVSSFSSLPFFRNLIDSHKPMP